MGAEFVGMIKPKKQKGNSLAETVSGATGGV